MSIELAGLAAAGASTLVAAVATDAWGAIRAGFARLFGRGDPARTELIERRLDRVERELAERSDADLAAARAQAQTQWQGRLADLLEEYPDAAEHLRALIASSGVAEASTGPVVQVYGDAEVKADDHSAAALQMRDVTVGGSTNPSQPGQPTG